MGYINRQTTAFKTGESFADPQSDQKQRHCDQGGNRR